MAAVLLNQLNTLMATMYSTGLLDDHFHQLQIVQNGGERGFVREIITQFCQDAERIINELAQLLNNRPDVDFDRVGAYIHQLTGSSGSVGAARVKSTCDQFHVCCQLRNRDACQKTLDTMRNEFYDLRQKFQTMFQLEQQIQAYYPK